MSIARDRFRPLRAVRSLSARRSLRYAGAALVLLMLGVAATAYLRGRPSAASPWQVRSIDRGRIQENVLTTGTLQPVLTVNVGSQISGQVRAIYVDYNSTVHRGQLLARLDTRTLDAQREQAEADLANAEAALANARANVVASRTAVDSAQAGIDAAQAALAAAGAARGTAAAQHGQAMAARSKAEAQVDINRLTHDRYRQLLAQNLVAQHDVDVARAALLGALSDLENARAQVRLAEAAVSSAQANLGSARASVTTALVRRRTAEAQLASAAAQERQALAQAQKAGAILRQIKVNLGYAEIRAPVDGVVISRLVDVGQTLAASFQTPVMFLVATDLHRMQVLASVDEADISHVFIGQKVSFTVNAWGGEVFEGGRVITIRNSPQTISNVVTYQVIIEVRNEALKLRPGMTANLVMEVATRDDAVRIPNGALRFRPDGLPEPAGPHVWVERGGTLEAVAVKTGITDGVNTELLTDVLLPGQTVVVAAARAGGARTSSPPPPPH